MKKLLLVFTLILASISSTYAYNNGISVAAGFTGTGYPYTDTEYVNISAYCPIQFSCTINRGPRYPTSGVGYAYVRHGLGGNVISSYDYQSGGSVTQSYSATYTGQWYQLELQASCVDNTIVQATLRW
ncbi:hypothetical protein [Desertivirga brevis]|uniref:hypothetical protein n=1 Tax=Desertivirga brevis TaxID=2810310 RepID=UPI001A95DA94|nr:hypothetical protein [Pedobacter sp. SYSU D00873]